VDLLTIDYQEAILQKKVDQLQEKSKEDQYVIEGKLSEKDRELKVIREKYEHDIQAIREETNERFNQIISMIQQNPKLTQVKPEILMKKNIG
jgi:CTP:phosphocholine cytidylyltransferase-like protein